MKYKTVEPGRFVSRPNRFIAKAEMNGVVETVHVKNTGRCKELLTPGATIYLEKGTTPGRKTGWDLIAVKKGDMLVNMDSQAPNKVFGEWADAGNFTSGTLKVHREVTFGDSRLDFMIETEEGPHYIEVKGVTLEDDGRARFPDAPTERGVRHIHELIRAVEMGYSASLVFIVQMRPILSVSPNDETQPEFGEALREATKKGVRIHAYQCVVTPDSLIIDKEIPVIL